jgi:small subunit ribosomal protein S20
MANNPSSKKRIKTNERNRLRNKAYKSAIKTIYKKCLLSLENYETNNQAKIENLISLAYSKIDKAVQKKVIHINNGAAKKSRLALSYKQKVGK